ncbi:MAG: hypothetical protein J6X80_03920 [Lachnospiraceae bacterium]|nr:hypothetical protein [Lachnospiraceae bacterium]
MEKKKLVSTILSIIIIGCGILAYIINAFLNIIHITGIIPLKDAGTLLNKGEYVEVEVDDIEYIGNVTNSYGFIPTGKEYYYAATDKENNAVYFVRASKNFRSQNTPVVIKGKVRSVDSNVSRAFGDSVDAKTYEGYNKSYSDKYLMIDCTVGFQSIVCFIAAFCILLGVVLLVANPAARNKQINELKGIEKAIPSIGILIILVGLVLALYTTTFIF